jgi:hypothetical protein
LIRYQLSGRPRAVRLGERPACRVAEPVIPNASDLDENVSSGRTPHRSSTTYILILYIQKMFSRAGIDGLIGEKRVQG